MTNPPEPDNATRVARRHGAGPAYLDAASSQPLHPAAREVLLQSLDEGFADPRRLHGAGRRARLMLDDARRSLADALGVRAEDLVLTSSGTDAVHRGLLGLAAGRARRSRLVAHTAVEHSAVLHAVAWHEQHGGEGHSLPVDRLGRVEPGAVEDVLALSPALLAVQAANHEVGTRQPLADVLAAATQAPDGPVPVFVDACAALGHEEVPGGWAALAGSAHKWGGPAGVGVLALARGARWRAPFPVDDRAHRHDVGHENVPAALAAAASLRAVLAERADVAAQQRRLVDRVRAEVTRLVPDVEVVGAPDDRLPHLVTFSVLYVDGEALVTELDRRGVQVASGSACTSSTLEPSHVLAAMGVLTHGNVRVSLTRDTTDADVDALLAALPEVVVELRGRAGLS